MAKTTLPTGLIRDGTIVNADIAAGAAIALTKLALSASALLWNDGLIIVGPTTSDQTGIGTSYVDVTGMGQSVVAGTYRFHYIIVGDTDATTTGWDLAVNGPTFDYLYATQFGFGSATASLARCITAYDHNTANISCAGTTKHLYEIWGIVKFNASGTFIPRVKRENVGSALNLRAGCIGQLLKVA